MLRECYKITLLTTLIALMGTANPAWALDWHDPEWTDMGCSSKLSGDWFPITASPYAGSKIEFKPNGASISSKANTRAWYALTPNSKDRQFLSFKQASGNPGLFPAYLKVRPHLAVQNLSKGKKLVQCKIKIFLFETKQKANQMSYLGWDIYSTLDILEVPNGN